MESHGIFSETFSVLQRSLDLRHMRHNLIVSNIANADTPHYRAFDLMVKEALAGNAGVKNLAIVRTSPGHISGGRTLSAHATREVTDASQFVFRGDGSSVDIDKEMTKLAENNLMYNALAQILAKKFQGPKSVIQSGK